MRELAQQELRTQLRIDQDREGVATHTSIARLVCRAIDRWRIAPTVRITNYAKEQLIAAGLDGEESLSRVREVYERLVLLGSVEAVYLHGRPHSARAEPRWINLSDDLGVLTGTIHDVDIQLIPLSTEAQPISALVRRFDPGDLDAIATLKAQGIEQWEIGDWRGELGYVEHLRRRAPSGESVALSAFWDVLTEDMVTSGLPLSDDAVVRAVVGPPGDHFGRGDGVKPTGRWSDAVPSGVWCGVRRGYSDDHWRPMLLSVDGDQRRGLDLYDWSEWRWALIARGNSASAPERVDRAGERLTFSYPLPNDLYRLMHLVGEQISGWTWRVAANVQELWETQ